MLAQSKHFVARQRGGDLQELVGEEKRAQLRVKESDAIGSSADDQTEIAHFESEIGIFVGR